MKIQESGENYLETILLLKKKKGAVRSVDVAVEMNFSKPSVSRAMNILKTAGHIEIDQNGFIKLTEQGDALARSVYERHELLTFFLRKLGVSEETAAKDACRIEHVISAETFEKIKEAM